MAGKQSSADKWQQVSREILDRLDIRAAYQELGVEITGHEPNGGGWLECRAFGRVDNSPSAGVNVGSEYPRRGRYKEFVGDGANLSLFEFAVLASPGRFTTWTAARDHFAEVTGVKLPSSKPPRNPTDSLEFRDYNEALVKSWCYKKQGVTEPAVKLCGGRIATESKRHTVVSLPVFGESGLEDDPCGWVSWNVTGKPLEIFAGKGIPPKYVKMKTASGSRAGWMGRHGLQVIETAYAVWVTEGPSDMLGLVSTIHGQAPGELDKNAVVCNSAGAMERNELDSVAMFAGKRVFVVPDCDQAGQTGCRRRAEMIAEVAERVLFVRLPFEITENHGKDLRDYFGTGATWEDLKQLAAVGEVIRRPVEAPSIADATQQQIDEAKSTEDKTATFFEYKLLEDIGLEVLGEFDGGSGKVKVFSVFHRKTDVIPEVSRLQYHRLVQICGPTAKSKVIDSVESVPDFYTMKQVREAISLISGYRRIEGNEYGIGCWQGKDEEGADTQAVVLVGAGEAAVRNGRPGLKRVIKPRYGGRLLDISSSDPWYDYEELSALVDSCDQAAAESTVVELETLFARWRWTHQGQAPKVLAGLVVATWVQTLWQWRPQISINGQSNAGKSTLFKLLEGLFGNLSLTSSDATGAGIIQAIANRAPAVLIDEFDSNRHRTEILEMLRMSGRGDKRLRGTAHGQKGTRFTLRHIVWTAGIESGLTREPDKNRFIRLELVKPLSKDMGRLNIPGTEELAALGQRTLAVALKFVFAARELADSLRLLKFPGVNERLVECYAVPAACYSLAVGSEAGQPSEVLQRMLECIGDIEDGVDDGRRLLSDILETEILLEKGERASVSQILERRQTDPLKLISLETKGVALVTHDNIRDGYLFISHNTVKRYLLRGTAWESQNIDEILVRLPGCAKARKRCGGRNGIWGIVVPMGMCHVDSDT